MALTKNKKHFDFIVGTGVTPVWSDKGRLAPTRNWVCDMAALPWLANAFTSIMRNLNLRR